MWGLMKADLYKAKKEKGIFIILLVAVALSVLLPLLYKAIENGIPGDISLYNGKMLFASSFGVSQNLGISIPIIICIYVNKDFSYRTIHNRILTGKPKWQIYLSNLIVSTIVAIIIIVFYSICNLLLGSLILGYGSPFNGKEFLYILKMLGYGIIIYAVLMSLITFLVYWLKSMPLSLVIYLVVSILLTSILSVLVNFNIYSNANEIPKVIEIINIAGSYTVFGQLAYLTTMVSFKYEILKILVVDVAMLVGITFLGMLVFKKSDVK